MRLIDADATLEQMKGMNMLFSPKIVIDNMPTVDTKQIRVDAIDECKYKIVDSLEKQLGCKICSSYEEKYHCSKCEMQKTINSTVDILEKLKRQKNEGLVIR